MAHQECCYHWGWSWVCRLLVYSKSLSEAISCSGLIAYREFTRPAFNFSIRVFECDSVPGGNWHYTDETPKDAPIPNDDPAVADYVPSLPPLHQALPYEETYHDDPAAFSWR